MLFPICHIHVVPDVVPDMCSLPYVNQYSILPSFNLNQMQYQGMMVFINLPNMAPMSLPSYPLITYQRSTKKTALLHASKCGSGPCIGEAW